MAFDDLSMSFGARPQPAERDPAPDVEPLPWPPPAAPAPRRGGGPAPLTPAAMKLAPAAPHRPSAARAKAGLGLITAAAGIGLGGMLGGPLGAVAGITGVGVARNLYRSQAIASTDPAEQGDGARSLAIGVLGLAVLGYLGYKIWFVKEGD